MAPPHVNLCRARTRCPACDPQVLTVAFALRSQPGVPEAWARCVWQGRFVLQLLAELQSSSGPRASPLWLADRSVPGLQPLLSSALLPALGVTLVGGQQPRELAWEDLCDSQELPALGVQGGHHCLHLVTAHANRYHAGLPRAECREVQGPWSTLEVQCHTHETCQGEGAEERGPHRSLAAL